MVEPPKPPRWPRLPRLGDDGFRSYASGFRRFREDDHGSTPSFDDLYPDIAGGIEQSEQVLEQKSVPSAGDSEKDFWVAITGFGAVLGTGLYVLAEGQWIFGGIFTAGGAGGLLVMSPLVRSKLGSWPSRKTMIGAVAITWLFLAANIGLSIHDKIVAPTAPVPAATGRVWGTLTSNEKTLLSLAVKVLPKRDHFRVICLTTDCKDLAADFMGAFHDAGWNPILASGSFFQEPYGLILYMKDPNDHSLAETIEKTTPLKVDHIEQSTDPYAESVAIGIRP